MECGIACRGKARAMTGDWVFGGQSPLTGGEVGLRAGLPWSLAREILRPGDESAVPRCPDPRGPGARSREAGLPSKPAWADRKWMRWWVALRSAEERLERRLTIILRSFRGL